MSTLTDEITQTYLLAIEEELKLAVEQARDIGNSQLYEILSYHMGWQDPANRDKPHSKRIRPLLVLLTCSAAGGNWQAALPASAAVELVHNFSLIHDDIEDNSPLRHGRDTVWKKWGTPHAINAGDAMFTLAHLQSVRMAEHIPLASALKAVEILQQACLYLTQGQYLDLAYEIQDNVPLEDYWHMVDEKTAALFSASTELGALSASAEPPTCEVLKRFGRLLGLAFQVQDDFLGIWGDSMLTGKSNQSDLVTRKKTLPVLYGLTKAGKFASLWRQKSDDPGCIFELIRLLEMEGGKEFTQAQGAVLVNKALLLLDEAHPTGLPAELLSNLVRSLTNRQV
ncbi:MAG TPA: polyprenyl synthetase family protein [Anaerolineales bacterium]